MSQQSLVDASGTNTAPVYRGLAGVYVDYTSICEIDDDNDKLFYRGYDVSDLSAAATFEDVFYLLLLGELPTKDQRKQLALDLDQNRYLSKEVSLIIDLLPIQAPPMAVLRTAISAIGCLDSGNSNPSDVIASAIKLVAQLPLIIGHFHARTHGVAAPKIKMGVAHAATVLSQFTGVEISDIHPDDIAVIDKLLIIHAEHELNASCFAARVTASAMTDLAAAVTSGISTLAGSLHGGANEQVLRTAKTIGSPDAAAAFVEQTFEKKQKIHGFGQRGCKAEDPRAILLRTMAEEIAARKGASNILPILLAVSQAVQQHRKLWPNVDFYSAAVLHDLGIDTELFTPMFACSRVVGWSAHVAEQMKDNRLIRPKAKYVGPKPRYIAS
jgi:citrate synthase